MVAAQVVARGKAEIRTWKKPDLIPGSVVIRPMILSVCGSDLRRIYDLPDNDYPLPPGTSGHEMIGVIEETDETRSGTCVGDLVLALAPNDDAMTEYFRASIEDVLRLPPHSNIEQLLMAQQVGTVIHACKRLPSLIGKNVVVIGQGSAGLFFDFMLRKLGAEKICGMDLEMSRIALAKKFGASYGLHVEKNNGYEAFLEVEGGELADLVVEATGEPEAINLAPKLVRKNGQLLFFGIPRLRSFPFEFHTFFRKYCFTNSISETAKEPGRTSVRMALDLIATGEVDVSSMLTHRFSFQRVMDAYKLARTREDGVIKVIIEMPCYRRE